MQRIGRVRAARAGGARGGDRRLVGLLFVASTLTFLTFQEGAITGSDGAAMFEVTRSIVEDGDLSVDDPSLGVPGRDGEPYAKYGIGQSLVALAPYVMAWPAATLLGERGDALERFAVSSMIPVVAGLLVVALFLLARRLGGGPRASALVAVGAVAGTYLLPYTKEFFSEPLAALAITLAIERTLARRFGWAAAALGLAILTRPQTLLFAPLAVWAWWREGGATGLRRSVGPLAVSGVVVAGYNLARFGDPLDFGYASEPGFTTSFWEGTRGLLLDPSASILLFAPVVVLVPAALAASWRSHPTGTLLLAGNAAITFAVTATWWSWAGGWSWGPRLLIPGLVPAIAALAPWIEQHRTRLRAGVALLVLGAVVSAPAMLVSTRAQQLDAAPPANGPGVPRQYALVPSTARHTATELRARPDGDHRRYLSLWQVNVLGELGPTGWAIVLPGTIGLGAGAAIAGRRAGRLIAAQTGEPYTEVSE